VAGEYHSQLEFGSQDLQHVVHTFCTVDRQSPEYWSTNQDCSGSKGQGFKYVCTATYATVQVHFAATGNGFNDFGKCVDTGYG
jgi:hypothetical protein